jgi:hypothetical protein
MPLLLFIGEKNKTRRTAEAMARRKTNAEKRGWDQDRINRMKADQGWSGYQTKQAWTDGTWGRSSSSSGAWHAGWRSNNNWRWNN